MYEFIPEELKAVPNWVCWKAEPDPKSHSGVSKKPINPKTGGFAMSNNPETWADFDTAVRVSSDFAGIGFMFSGSGFFGVDLDDMGGELADFMAGDTDNIIGEFVGGLQSYTELSNSGNGIHIICRGKLPEGGRRRGQIEMYDKGRFFVMTGKSCSQFDEVADGTEAIKPLHSKYLGNSTAKVQQAVPIQLNDVHSVVQRALNSANGEKFRRLYGGDFSAYPSQSEADLAFCNMLAFWCGGDKVLMDRIYRSSGLMREKWDRRQSGSTYGALTLNHAVESCQNFYQPEQREEYKIRVSNPDIAESVQPAKKLYTFDDTGNAERLRDLFGDILRYNYIERKWVYYSGGKWNYDNTGYIRQLADKAVESMQGERLICSQIDEREGSDLEKEFMKHYKRSRSFNGKTNFIHEAEHYSPVLPSMFDCHKSLINCKNGIADLRTGELMPHDKEKMMTKMTFCSFPEKKTEIPHWLKFLDEIFAGDKEMIRYIQKAVGYSLTGSTSEQCVFFLLGNGRNGKSTFLEVIRAIFGDYATNIQPQTIMSRPASGNAPTSDIARLKGARFVTGVEPNEGAKLDEGLIKQLTGGDVVTARKMFAEEFEFKPEFKLWLATNHKPVIRGNDLGIWRRIHVIPFTVSIPEDKVDTHLKYKLAKELDGIFAWAVEGCGMWLREGLQMPSAVKEAVREYQHEMDVISAFLDSCCTAGGEVKASSLYLAYAQWADKNNEYLMSNTKFGREMQKKYNRIRKSGKYYYKDISLINESDYYVSVKK